MPRKRRWETLSVEKGIHTIEFESWRTFFEFIHKEMLDYNHYVWRGERCDNRDLLPSFDRRHKKDERKKIEDKLSEHLEKFKMATCGRRGANPPKIENENEWWALGQHFGLSSPLLDWTRSPFVALFFAFEKEKLPQTKNRCLYAVNPAWCEYKSKIISPEKKVGQRPDILEFFTPQQDENSRLLNQNGLFSRCTAGKSIESWIQSNYQEKDDNGMLLKMLIPNKERENCLRTLNKMNINHLTLFPDLYGASSYSNMVNRIERY